MTLQYKYQVNNISIEKFLRIFSFMTLAVFAFSQENASGLFSSFFLILQEYQVKYIFMILSLFLNAIYCILFKRKMGLRKENFQIVRNVLLAYFAIFLVTICKQLANGFEITSYLLLSYSFLPLIYFFFCSLIDDKFIQKILDNLIWVYLISFLFANFGKISISNILSISFLNSYSPFESGIGNYLILLEFYYLFTNQKGKALVSQLIILLSFKRIEVVFSLFVFLFWPLLRKIKKISNVAFFVSILFFALSPLFLNYFYSTQTQALLYEKYSIDFNLLSLDRYDRVIFVKENLGLYDFGFGTVDKILENYRLVSITGRNLHCDLLMIFYDTGFVSVILFVYFMFQTSKRNAISYIIILFMFFDMIFNHPLGAGNVDLWVLVFFVVYYCNTHCVLQDFKKRSVFLL